MSAVAVLPWALGLTGALYGATAVALSAAFTLLALRVGLSRVVDPAAMRAERALFKFSIAYLFLLFGALVFDRLLLA